MPETATGKEGRSTSVSRPGAGSAGGSGSLRSAGSDSAGRPGPGPAKSTGSSGSWTSSSSRVKATPPGTSACSRSRRSATSLPARSATVWTRIRRNRLAVFGPMDGASTIGLSRSR